MDTVIIDTDILINHARGKTQRLSELILQQKAKELVLIIPSIVIFEFYSGASLASADIFSMADLLFSQFKIQELNEEIAKVGAQLNRTLKLYEKIDTADIIIGATCIFLSAKLCTGNKRHFLLIPQINFLQ